MTERKTGQSPQIEKGKRFAGTVMEITQIPNSPFLKASLDNDFSIMLVPGTNQIDKGNTLKIIPDTRPVHLSDSREIRITKDKKLVEKIYISECQIIPNERWDETVQSLIEQSKKSENWRHKGWWEEYDERKKPQKEINPNWLEDLKKAASLGIINGYLD